MGLSNQFESFMVFEGPRFDCICKILFYTPIHKQKFVTVLEVYTVKLVYKKHSRKPEMSQTCI